MIRASNGFVVVRSGRVVSINGSWNDPYKIGDEIIFANGRATNWKDPVTGEFYQIGSVDDVIAWVDRDA